MLKSLLPVAALAGFAVPAHSQAADPIEVMVLGTYHMGNPGRDLVNVRADDVTAPKRQAEQGTELEGVGVLGFVL